LVQRRNQKISRASKAKDVDTRNFANEQLQFSENSSQITVRTDESLKESDSSTNNQREFFTTFEEQLQKTHEEVTARLKKLKQRKNLKNIQNKIKELEAILESNSFESQENDSIDSRQTESTSLLDNESNAIDDVTAIEN